MSTSLPDWLASAIPNSGPAHANLAIARLGDETTLGKGGFALSSVAFGNGEMLDPSFTAEEEDAVAPPLEWTAPPPAAQEIVLLVEDPAGADGKPLLHWLVWSFPGQKGQLLEGEVPPRVGKNGRGNSEWLLPSPSEDDGVHDYVFQLFALDLPLTLMPGATQDDIEAQIKGHIVATALLTGRFEATGEDEWVDHEPFETGD